MTPSAPPPPLPSLPCPPARADEFIGEPTPGVVRSLAAQPGPALVLGAGGKLGLHVTYMLQQAFRALGREERVLAVSRFRTLRSRDDFEQRGLATIACDLEDPAALAALPDAPTVIFLAGVKFGTAAAPDLLRRLNVEMPRRVAERFHAARIVAFSTGAVYPFMPVDGRGATESTPRGPVGEYAASCVEREKAFEEVSLQHGTKVALIRLNYSVEFRYGVLVDIAQRVMREEPIDVSMCRLNLIWQGDAVALSLQALELAGSPAVPVNVTGPESYSVRELAQRFGRIFGVEPRLRGREAETAALNDASRTLRRFGPPRVSLEEMISWTAAWQRQIGTSWGKPTGFENRNGNY